MNLASILRISVSSLAVPRVRPIDAIMGTSISLAATAIGFPGQEVLLVSMKYQGAFGYYALWTLVGTTSLMGTFVTALVTLIGSRRRPKIITQGSYLFVRRAWVRHVATSYSLGLYICG
jgi:hypothetical protein